MPALDRQHDLATIPQASDDHQQAGLLLLQARLDVDSIGPQVDRLEAAQATPAPGIELSDPLASQPLDRARRQRRCLAQETAQRQLKVSLSQAVEVELRKQRGHLVGPATEQRQDLALKALLQATDPRTM